MNVILVNYIQILINLFKTTLQTEGLDCQDFHLRTVSLNVSILCLLAAFSRSVVSDSLRPHRLQPTRRDFLGFPRREYWSGLPFPPPGDLPYPGTEPASPVSPA